MKNKKGLITGLAAIVLIAGVIFLLTKSKAPDDMLSANLAALSRNETPDYSLRSNDTLLRFDLPTADLGRVKMAHKKEVVFRFTNVSSGPVVITSVMTTCDCTSAEWDKAPLMAGKESEIEVTFEAKERGTFFKKLFIYYAGSSAPLEIAITGEVK